MSSVQVSFKIVLSIVTFVMAIMLIIGLARPDWLPIIAKILLIKVGVILGLTILWALIKLLIRRHSS